MKRYDVAMKDIVSLINEYESLPNGYISKKKINNKTQYYLQYFSNGTIQSKYISKNELDNIRNKIKRRKELKIEIDKLKTSGSSLPVINENAKALTGSLMSGNIEVARFVNGELIYIDEEKAPLFIARTHNLYNYLSRRVIDDSRVNSRILKRALNITEKENALISLKAHGAVLTDNYWFRAKHSKTKYEDICFTDIYADIALKGHIYFSSSHPRLSPELTTVGSYEKCWRKIDNQWWLYKSENQNELFSELFSSSIAILLGIPSVKYKLEDGYIKSPNFASLYNFEPMSSLANNDDTYNNVFNIINDINPYIAREYVALMYFDALVNNIDRHNENYGLLRNKETGQILSLAPNFDNNLSLLATDPNLSIKNNGFLNIFIKFIKENELAHQYLSELKIHTITSEEIKDIIKTIPIKVDEQKVINYILNRQNKLKKAI